MDLSQDTVLLLCDNRGGTFGQLRLLNLADQWQLESLLDVDPQLSAGRYLRVDSVLAGEETPAVVLVACEDAKPRP